MKDITLLAQRMADLYKSNPRSTGRFDPATGKMHTTYNEATLEDFAKHLVGEGGIGTVPILDDNTSLWAAIDVDNHDSDEDIPIAALSEKITELRLPLIPCRSKSGGVHCYLFMSEPVPASRVRGVLTKWAAQLGYAGHEVFPKQSRLVTDAAGRKQLGNWINLPYLNGDGTNRYAVRQGKQLSVHEFLTLAERSRVTLAELQKMELAEHAGAPPCVQRMISEGVGVGHRNEAIFNVAVYLRKRNPEGFMDQAEELNRSIFSRPLPKAELNRTVSSAAKPDYGYRCNEEPARGLCDRAACLKAKYGISSADVERLEAHEALPEFTDLCKYLTEPVRWEVKINGVPVHNITTPQLLAWPAMREIIADRLTMVVPVIKPAEWERLLAAMMREARIIETPDDASVNGMMRARLREFAGKTDLASLGESPPDERKALLRGLPIVQKMDGDRCVVFRAQDFINYLKRTKSEEIKGINLWFAIKDLGVRHGRLRVGSAIINVWHVPVSIVMQDVAHIERREFNAEI